MSRWVPLDEFLQAHADAEEAELRLAAIRNEVARRRRAAEQARTPRIVRQEKRCPRCEQTKPIDAFGIDSGRLDGRQGYCRACRSAR